MSAVPQQVPATGPVWCGGDEGIAAEHVDVLIAERGQPGGIRVIHEVAGLTQCIIGCIGAMGVPEHDRVQRQAECTDLVFLAFLVALIDLPVPFLEGHAYRDHAPRTVGRGWQQPKGSSWHEACLTQKRDTPLGVSLFL